MIPYIVKHENAGPFEVTVATPCLDWLLEEFHDFKLVVDYDPFEPAEKDLLTYGIRKAKKRVRINTHNNAAEAIRDEWGYGPAECYRNAV